MNAAMLQLRMQALSGATAFALFIALASVFFLSIDTNPLAMLAEIARSAWGDGYALGETLLRATPILLCALATIVPARAGLISVGAEGQLYFGALIGTGFLLATGAPSGAWMLPATLLAGALGGALWALTPALLRVGANANETISTLLLNYVAALLVTWLVYGPWKNPQSQGWPASIEFPMATRLPLLFDSRAHAGLFLAVALALLLHLLLTRSRWGLELDLMRSSPRAALLAGFGQKRRIVLTLLTGGLLAGLAGIAETSSVQGRLQADLSNGAGLSGFLVAWLARNSALRAIAWAFIVAGLLAAGDGLQMNANIPSSATLVVQGLLFVAVLLAGGLPKLGQVRSGAKHD
ncbi:MAG: ABC transporter permease [Polaromonas sp.]|nr:ABC transporter permease [Polaromonas sp.]